MSRLARSFLGAFFGTFMAIWPAATLNMAVLIVPACLLGWLAGYHGDRVLGGLRRGWRHARRVGFQAFIKGLEKKNVIIRQIFAFGRSVKKWGDKTGTFIGAAFGLVPALFRLAGRGITAPASAIYHSPGGFHRWRTASRINRMMALQFVASALGGLIITGTLLWLVHGVSGEIGSTYYAKDYQNKLQPHTVSLFMVIMQEYILPLMVSAVLVMVGHVSIISETVKSRRTAYGVWKRYTSMPAPIFVASELARFFYLGAWFLGFVLVALIGGIILLMVGAVAGLVLAPAYLGTVYGILVTWRLIRLNRDYGVVSLATALLVGTITFFSLRTELVADPLYRLGASTLAGMGAGALSMAITALCGMVFGLSITLRRIAIKKPKSLIVDENSLLDGFINSAGKAIARAYYQAWVLLLPPNAKRAMAV